MTKISACAVPTALSATVSARCVPAAMPVSAEFSTRAEKNVPSMPAASISTVTQPVPPVTACPVKSGSPSVIRP